MSLFSYLNADSSSSTASAQIAQAMQLLATKQGNAAKSTATTDKAKSTVTITVEAKRIANAKADSGKDATALATELRTSLDAQYKTAGKKNAADLTALSGRALATIALNQGDRFSRAEIAAAKLELRTRDRHSALDMLSSGPLTSATLTTYTTNLIAARESMSAEEQKLRASDPSLR